MQCVICRSARHGVPFDTTSTAWYVTDMADLTSGEKKFIAAFVTTARRDAYMASLHAGLGLNRDAALALLATPAVRLEVERLSMPAKIVDGVVNDVNTLHPLNQNAPVTPVNAARRDLIEELRGKVRAASEKRVAVPSGPEPQILTDKGEIAGSAKELYNRVQRAKRVQQHDPDPSERPGLEQRLERSQHENVAEDRGDGSLYVYDKRLATPYEVKLFLSQVMAGQHSVNITTRLQAAALLAKAYGMFDAKTIEREKELDKLTPSSVEDIQAKIRQTRAEINRLKGDTTDEQPDDNTDAIGFARS